jgi:RNA polymerase sigma factor (sigma-70 family)
LSGGTAHPAHVSALRSVAVRHGVAADGALDAVSAAYDSCAAELYSFALRATREPAAAQDAVQETFLRLTRAMTSGAMPDNVHAWLFRVLGNLVASRGRRARVSERLRHLFVARDVVGPPDDAALGRERAAALESELAKLRPAARTGLLMSAHGFSMREIAGALGRSEGATRTLLCRARLTVRRGLEASEAFDDHA